MRNKSLFLYKGVLRIASPMTPQPPFQPSPYWYTLRECAVICRCSLRTVYRYLPLIPPQHKRMVRGRVGGMTRKVNYWRIAPDGLRTLGHKTGTATYL